MTFPVEARFADADFARRTYARVVRRYIDSGVRTARLALVGWGADEGVDDDVLLLWHAAFGGDEGACGCCASERCVLVFCASVDSLLTHPAQANALLSG